jgi:hypothetical protein
LSTEEPAARDIFSTALVTSKPPVSVLQLVMRSEVSPPPKRVSSG